MGGGQLLNWPRIVSVYYKSTFRGAFLLYNTNGHATMDTRPVEPVHKLSTFLPIVADLVYYRQCTRFITLNDHTFIHT